METGRPLTADEVAARLAGHFDILDQLADEAGLSAHAREKLAKARRVLDAMQATLVFFWTMIAVRLETWKLSQPASSEMAKLFENSLRTTSIAFIHEWTRFAERVGINFFEVIDSLQARRGSQAARSPTFGVGGYRLTQDPLLAQWARARELDLLD